MLFTIISITILPVFGQDDNKCSCRGCICSGPCWVVQCGYDEYHGDDTKKAGKKRGNIIEKKQE